MLKNGFCQMSVVVAAMFLLSMTVSGQEASRTEQKGVTYSINVAGMTCATCSAHAQQALLKVPASGRQPWTTKLDTPG